MNTLSVGKPLKSLKPLGLKAMTREGVRQYFVNTWELYEVLFSSIKSDESFYQKPDPLRNPLIFYLGHTAAFYSNKLKLAGLIKEGIDEKKDHLFAVGVDPDLPQDLNDSAYWPTVSEVRAYRKTVYQMVHRVIDQMNLNQLPLSEDQPEWALLMALEHDRIHFETSSMLIRQLGVELLERPVSWTYAKSNGHAPDNEWLAVTGGRVRLGKSSDATLFGWDNEYGSLEVEVQGFKATKNLVSNAAFMDFYHEGGYDQEALWTKEGWDWKVRTGSTAPKFWIIRDGGIHYRALFDEMPLPMDWPVEVNAHEALAYCAWKKDGSRLLSEAEFNRIALDGQPADYDPLFTEHHNLDLMYGSPTAVGAMETGTTASGFNDIYGNVWDWLSDDFYALPKFEVHPYYENFSKPYMDAAHGMMAGGSWATTGTGASRYYRLWFRRHFFQHAGFRLAKDV